MDVLTGKYFHLAGIISLIGYRSNFNMDWHDSLMPLAPDYTLLEKAVLDCALAGCETIWIVCNDDITPLVKYRLGDWVHDPVWKDRHRSKVFFNLRKEVPIFYIPTHPDDLDRRDCMGWGILHGAQTAAAVCGQISKWTRPSAYFVSFPYGVYDQNILRANRSLFSSNRRAYLKYGGASVENGHYYGFTFLSEDIDLLVKKFKKNPQNLFFEGKKLPLQDRYTGKHMTLEKVFEPLNFQEKYDTVELDWGYSIVNWADYVATLNAKEIDGICGQKRFFEKKLFNKIPQEEETNVED